MQTTHTPPTGPACRFIPIEERNFESLCQLAKISPDEANRQGFNRAELLLKIAPNYYIESLRGFYNYTH